MHLKALGYTTLDVPRTLHQLYPDQGYEKLAQKLIRKLIYKEDFIDRPMGPFGWDAMQVVVKEPDFYHYDGKQGFLAFLYFQTHPYFDAFLEQFQGIEDRRAIAAKTLVCMFSYRFGISEPRGVFLREFIKRPIHRDRLETLFRLAAPYTEDLIHIVLENFSEHMVSMSIDSKTAFLDAFIAHLGDECIDRDFPIETLILSRHTSLMARVLERNLEPQVYRKLLGNAFIGAAKAYNFGEIDRLCPKLDLVSIGIFCNALEFGERTGNRGSFVYALVQIVSHQLDTLLGLGMHNLRPCMKMLSMHSYIHDSDKELSRLKSIETLSSAMYKLLQQQTQSTDETIYYGDKRRLEDTKESLSKRACTNPPSDVIVID